MLGKAGAAATGAIKGAGAMVGKAGAVATGAIKGAGSVLGSTAIMGAAGVAGAGALGYGAGTLVNEHLISDDVKVAIGDTIGMVVDNVLGFIGNDVANDRLNMIANNKETLEAKNQKTDEQESIKVKKENLSMFSKAETEKESLAALLALNKAIKKLHSDTIAEQEKLRSITMEEFSRRHSNNIPGRRSPGS